jgi:hypothetical protein
MSLNAVSKHARVLEQVRLVRLEQVLMLGAKPPREVARWPVMSPKPASGVSAIAYDQVQI